MTESKLNPLRIDPTRTTMLRKKFLSDMGKRFRGLRGSIRNLVVVEDAFGLKQRVQNPVLATQTATYRTLDTDVVTNTRWQFETADAKVDDYRAWLTSQVQAGILQVSDDNQATPWLEPYVRSAYKQGLLRAYHDTTGISTTGAKDWSFIEGGKAAFLDMAFNTPEAEAKIRLLSTRAYSQLEGVTASMDAEMSRILATGLANGSGPGEIGKQLNDSVSKLQRTRANTIARTETTYAHSEGQLDSFAAMNVDEVGVMAEWNTAHDGKVCPICRPLEGVVMTIDEARSLIPRHPNCRCAWLPASVGEQSGGTTKSMWLDGGTTGQVYAKDEADARIRKSLKAEKPGLSTKDARAASTWTGADVKLSKKNKPKATDLKKDIAELKKKLARKQAATRAEKIKAAKRALPGTPEFFDDSMAAMQSADLNPWETGGLPGWTETGIYYTEHDKNLEAAILAGEVGDQVLFEEVVWGNADISIDGIKASNAMPKSKQKFKAKVYKKDGGYYPIDEDAANAIAAQWAKHGPDAMLDVQVMDLDAVAAAQAAAAQAQKEVLEAKLVQFGVTKDMLKFSGTLDEVGNYPKMKGNQLSLKVANMFPDNMPTATQSEIFEHAAYDLTGGFDAQLRYVQGEIATWQTQQAEAAKLAALLEEVGFQKQFEASKFLGKKVSKTDPKQAAFIDSGWEQFQKMPGWKNAPGKTQSYGVILFDDNGKILLRKPTGGFGGANWTFAKGGGSHKLPATTALAELGEETGYTADLVSAMPNAYTGQSTKTNFFIGKKKGYSELLMDDETEAVEFMTYAQAHTAIMQSPDAKVRARDMAILNDAYEAAGLLADKPMGSMGDLVLTDIVSQGEAILMAQEKAAGKAAQSYKVKLGMSKKHYAKPKFGGGVVADDFDTPDKLATSGINKVLSEKGWHMQTVAPEVDDALANATNIVEQKAVLDKLKKAPKGTKQIPLVEEVVEEVVQAAEEFEDVMDYGELAMFVDQKIEAFDSSYMELKNGKYKTTEMANVLQEALDIGGIAEEYDLSKSQVGLLTSKAATQGGYKYTEIFKQTVAEFGSGDVVFAQKEQLKATTAALNKLLAEAVGQAPAKKAARTAGTKAARAAGAIMEPKELSSAVAMVVEMGETITMSSGKYKPSKMAETLADTLEAVLWDQDALTGPQLTAIEEAVSSGVDAFDGVMKDYGFGAVERAQAAQINETVGMLNASLKMAGVKLPAKPVVKKTIAEARDSLPEMKDLKYVQSLAGSTKPYKAKHAITGEHWVVKSLEKSSMTEAHMRSEALSDQLYRAAGFDVPESMIIEDTTGPAKVSRWIENGTTLQDWQRDKTTAEVEAMYDQISEGFVADALFANHDVAGMSYDNIFIADGKPYRIDNGGGLAFRAQGAPKANFGAEVMELTSMRDKQYSGPNAAIFANINDKKINAQIEKLLEKKERMLGLVDDPGLRATLAARFDYLEARLPKKKGPKRPRGVRRAEYEVTDKTVDKIKENKSNGYTLAVDKDYIEDHNALAWQEFDVDGDRQTVLSMNLTMKGDQEVKKTLAGELGSTARAAGATPSGHPEDLGFFEEMLPSIKNIYHHSPGGNGDLKFNPTHVKNLEDMRGLLVEHLILAKKPSAGKPEQTVAMLKHYIEQVETALEGVTSGKGVAVGFKASAYKYKPGKKVIDKAIKTTPKTNRAFRASKYSKAPQNKAVKFKDGEIYRGKEVYEDRLVSGEAYQIDAGDGVVVRYVPVKDASRESQSLQALQGQIEIEIPGEVSKARLKQAMTVLKDLGIDPEPPTPIQEELLYLHRGVYQHNKHTNVTYKRIWENTDITDEEKLSKMKHYIKTKTKLTGGKDVDKMPGYDPAGVGKHAAGGGHRVFYRWDINREQMGKDMDGFVLQHTTQGLSESPQGAVESAIRGIGQSGGEFTSTTGRIRKGVPLSAGDTPGSDIRTGGANYWFTRVKEEERSTNGFFFDVRELARQDSVSYERDEYGRISSFKKRGATPAKYKEFFNGGGSNESNFKEGFSWDQLDFIRVRPGEKAGVLRAFKELKMTHLPDGRPVEKIITTTRKPPARKWRKKAWVPISGNG